MDGGGNNCNGASSDPHGFQVLFLAFPAISRERAREGPRKKSSDQIGKPGGASISEGGTPQKKATETLVKPATESTTTAMAPQ